METVEERLHRLMRDKFGLEAGKDLGLEKSLVDDLGLDSLDLVDMVQTLEQEFRIEIPDEAMEPLKTVGDVLGYLEISVPRDTTAG